MMLVIGYGNPGRCDDGLGPAFVERIAERALQSVQCITDYQLKVEHALLLKGVDRVVFVDAHMSGSAPYTLRSLATADRGDVMSHSLTPEILLALAETLLDAVPTAFMLAIRGCEFGCIHEGLSSGATRNLGLAETFFLDWLSKS